ncbi:MAG: pilus assembly protein [Proteobacteria bacterium]|nr:pilus assembly protein [Pseudomonadota bacterium]
MSVSEAAAGGAKPRKGGVLARWGRNSDGVAALEFAMVALPFFMMLFGIIGVGLYYFTIFSLENAVEQASRLIRTGQAQGVNYTQAQFQTQVCNLAPGFIDCANGLRVNVMSYASLNNVTAATFPNCLDGGGNLSGTTKFDMGGASSVVVIWACYEWKLAAQIPFIKLGNMSNGSYLIQATTIFRTEPYS